MTRSPPTKYFSTLALMFELGFLSALAPLAAHAAQAPEHYIGRVLSVRGEAVVRPTGDLKLPTEPLNRGQYLNKGAIIRTRKNAAVRLLMKDKSILDIGPSSYFTLARYEVKEKKRSVGLHLFVGRIWARVTSIFGSDKNYNIYTPNAVAGVRGTELVVDVDLKGNSQITCVTGSVAVNNSIGGPEQLLGALQRSTVDARGQAQQSRVTPQEVKEMAKSVATGNALNPKQAAQRIQNANTQADSKRRGEGGQGQGPRKRKPRQMPEQDRAQNRLDDLRGDISRPPLDLEPSTGRTRIRGTIKVVDP